VISNAKKDFTVSNHNVNIRQAAGTTQIVIKMRYAWPWVPGASVSIVTKTIQLAESAMMIRIVPGMKAVWPFLSSPLFFSTASAVFTENAGSIVNVGTMSDVTFILGNVWLFLGVSLTLNAHGESVTVCHMSVLTSHLHVHPSMRWLQNQILSACLCVKMTASVVNMWDTTMFAKRAIAALQIVQHSRKAAPQALPAQSQEIAS
jgi:hypothetical protein